MPDFLIRVAFDGPGPELLLELTTLHFDSSTYGNEVACGHAVDRRACALPGEYAAKAREVDRRFVTQLLGPSDLLRLGSECMSPRAALCLVLGILMCLLKKQFYRL